MRMTRENVQQRTVYIIYRRIAIDMEFYFSFLVEDSIYERAKRAVSVVGRSTSCFHICSNRPIRHSHSSS